MDDNNRKHNFLAYINNLMSIESIMMIYDANNVKIERCDLYNDFVQSLLMIVFDTYMGDDVSSPDDQINHFNWCWEKNIENFKKEGFTFNSVKLYNYFKEFTLEVFYNTRDKNVVGYTDKKSLSLWSDIFDFKKRKTNSDLDTLIEIYKLFDKSLIPNY